jgi:hypothetical protein
VQYKCKNKKVMTKILETECITFKVVVAKNEMKKIPKIQRKKGTV